MHAPNGRCTRQITNPSEKRGGGTCAWAGGVFGVVFHGEDNMN